MLAAQDIECGLVMFRFSGTDNQAGLASARLWRQKQCGALYMQQASFARLCLAQFWQSLPVPRYRLSVNWQSLHKEREREWFDK